MKFTFTIEVTGTIEAENLHEAKEKLDALMEEKNLTTTGKYMII